MRSVIETPTFLRHAKLAGMSDDERAELVAAVAVDPEAGEVMVGTGGARKLRFAKPGAGKSGGYRVITFYAAADVPVFLLDVFGKGEKVNLTKAERNELSGILSKIVDDYRAGVRASVKMRKETKR